MIKTTGNVISQMAMGLAAHSPAVRSRASCWTDGPSAGEEKGIKEAVVKRLSCHHLKNKEGRKYLLTNDDHAVEPARWRYRPFGGFICPLEPAKRDTQHDSLSDCVL